MNLCQGLSNRVVDSSNDSFAGEVVNEVLYPLKVRSPLRTSRKIPFSLKFLLALSCHSVARGIIRKRDKEREEKAASEIRE
jgi:hypothetical protein